MFNLSSYYEINNEKNNNNLTEKMWDHSNWLCESNELSYEVILIIIKKQIFIF